MCYADPAKAARVLGWKAEKGLDEMCRYMEMAVTESKRI